MFTSHMYERLSEWFSNLSLLFVGIGVLPFVMSQNKLISVNDITVPIMSTFIYLWLSLRFSRIAEGRK